MDNIELSFDTSKCPNMNDHEGYMVCNLENFDQALRQSDLPEEFKNFPTMDRFSPFMGFCQKFKFQEGVHMCLVARKKELEKKKLENKFKSRAAYLKACRSWPKKQKIFFRHVTDPGEDFVTMERFHRVKWNPTGCLVIWTKLPSKYKSLKDAASYHRIMLVFSPIREKFFNYQSALAHLIGFKCIRKKGQHCLSCNRMMFSGAGVVAALLMLFFRHEDRFDHHLIESELFDCNLPLGPNQPPRHFPDERGDTHPSALDESSDSDYSGDSSDNDDDDNNDDGTDDEEEQPSDSDNQDSDDDDDDSDEEEMDVDENLGPNQPSGRNQAASSTMSGTSGSSSSRPTFQPPFRRPVNPSSPTASEHLATSTPIHGTTTSTRRRRPMPNQRSTRQRNDIPSMSTLHLTDDPLEDMFAISSTSSRSQSDLEIALNRSRRQIGRPTEELGVARMDNFNGHR